MGKSTTGSPRRSEFFPPHLKRGCGGRDHQRNSAAPQRVVLGNLDDDDPQPVRVCDTHLAQPPWLVQWALEYVHSGACELAPDGVDVSPPLQWSSVPGATQSLVLIADDPEAPRGTFVHWVIYNLPPDTRRLPEDVLKRETLPSGAAQGVNGAGRVGYMGPCPPGGTHRYFFKVYVLDRDLDLGGGATKEDLLDAMEGHILAEGRLVGTYRRG